MCDRVSWQETRYLSLGIGNEYLAALRSDLLLRDSNG